MTLTQSAVFLVVCLGISTVVFYIWVAHRHHGRRRSYLPFIDLLSYGLTGSSIIVGIIVALNAFADQYPRKLEASGMTNEAESYRPIFEKVRELYSYHCSTATETSVDCAEMERFFDGSLQVVEGDAYFAPFESPLATGTAAETRKLIEEYNYQLSITPKIWEVVGEVLSHLTWLSIPLWVGFALGMHRRWILYRQSLQLEHEPGR